MKNFEGPNFESMESNEGRNFEKYQEETPDGPTSDIESAHERFENEASRHNWERNWLVRYLNLNEKTKENIASLYSEQMEDFINQETEGDNTRETEALAKWHILYGPTRINIADTNGFEDPTKFIELRNSWAESSDGQLSVEDINAWPEIKSQAMNQIVKLGELPGVECSRYVQFRDSWAEAGVVDSAEINEKVKKKVLEKIEHHADSNHPGIPCSKFVEVRDNWVNAGVVSVEEANAVAHKHALERIEHHADSNHPGIPCSKFVEVRDNWVNAGVVSVEEANAVAHKHAKIRIGEAIQLPGVDENELIEEWSVAGVVSKNEFGSVA